MYVLLYLNVYMYVKVRVEKNKINQYTCLNQECAKEKQQQNNYIFLVKRDCSALQLQKLQLIY